MTVTARLNGAAVLSADLDRAVAFLANLPADQQPDLNERLLETAGQLDTVKLGEPLTRFQAALGRTDVADLLDRFVQFQASCGTLSG